MLIIHDSGRCMVCEHTFSRHINDRCDCGCGRVFRYVNDSRIVEEVLPD